MDKKELVVKIGETLQVPENKYDFTFHMFLKKLASSLKNNQALKIPELGVFQLKKETPLRGEKSNLLEPDNILFVPFNKPGETKDAALFLTFEVPDSKLETIDFDEEVFSPSVDKPLIPIGEDLKKETIDETVNPIENKLTELIKNSEILDDFEIWKEYSSVMEEMDEDLETTLSGDDIKKSGILGDIEEEEEKLPEPEKEDEIGEWDWSEDLEEELIVSDDASESDDSDSEEPALEIDEKKLEQKMKELSGDSKDVNLIEEEAEEEEVVKEEVPDTVEEPKEEEEEEEDPFKALEQTIIDETEEPIPDEEIEKLVDQKSGSTTTDSQSESSLRKTASKKFDTDGENGETAGFLQKYKYYLLGVGALVILYWLFWPTNGEPVKEHIVNGSNAVNEKVDNKNVVASFDEEKATSDEKKSEEKNKNTGEKESEKTSAVRKKHTTPIVENKIPQRQTLTHQGDMYKEIKNERSVGGNIYYDGNEYMIQVSSWRNNIVAEKEVQKLRRKGFDAFIVKAYVKKYGATFHRVRIGGFATKQEALNFKRKNL